MQSLLVLVVLVVYGLAQWAHQPTQQMAAIHSSVMHQHVVCRQSVPLVVAPEVSHIDLVVAAAQAVAAVRVMLALLADLE